MTLGIARVPGLLRTSRRISGSWPSEFVHAKRARGPVGSRFQSLLELAEACDVAVESPVAPASATPANAR